MKKSLPVILALACVALIVSFIMTKRGDDARRVADAGNLDSVSNQLAAAQTQIAFRDGTMLELSNSLAATRSSVLTFSNQLTAAQSSLALYAEQVANLNQQISTVQSEKLALGQRVATLTNQVAGLSAQLSLTQTNLDAANRNYALLENRLRIDVAKRLVLERQFQTPSELQAQLRSLKQDPAYETTADSIYAGLDIEVKSNSFHVIAPN